MCLDYDTFDDIGDLQMEAIDQFLSGGIGTDGSLEDDLEQQSRAAYPDTEIPYGLAI